MSAAEAHKCRLDHRGSVSTQTRPGTAFSMPPKRKGAPGAGAKAGGRERKPAMKRGRGGGGGAHANKSKAAAPGGKSKGKGAGAAHRAQSFYEVDEDAHQCVDRNECLMGLSPCTGNSECVNVPGSFYCRCPAGYQLGPTG